MGYREVCISLGDAYSVAGRVADAAPTPSRRHN
jgi:hypothetical protein